MKHLLLVALLGVPAPVPAPHSHLPAEPGKIHSHLIIGPGKQFLLGGNQRTDFQVAGRNVGRVAVEVLERPPHGTAVWRAQLAPGQRTSLRFANGSAAVLLNGSPLRRAVLELDISTPASLDMTYEAAPKNQ